MKTIYYTTLKELINQINNLLKDYDIKNLNSIYELNGREFVADIRPKTRNYYYVEYDLVNKYIKTDIKNEFGWYSQLPEDHEIEDYYYIVRSYIKLWTK